MIRIIRYSRLCFKTIKFYYNNFCLLQNVTGGIEILTHKLPKSWLNYASFPIGKNYIDEK